MKKIKKKLVPEKAQVFVLGFFRHLPKLILKTETLTNYLLCKNQFYIQ